MLPNASINTLYTGGELYCTSLDMCKPCILRLRCIELLTLNVVHLITSEHLLSAREVLYYCSYSHGYAGQDRTHPVCHHNISQAFLYMKLYTHVLGWENEHYVYGKVE